MNPIIDAATKFRAQLIAGQNNASAQMLDAWAQTLKTLTPRLEATIREMDADGTNPQALFEQQRLQKILADVAHEVRRYGALVDPIIADRQKEAIELAQGHAKTLTVESLGPAPAGANATWSTVDPGTLENLVGLTAEGSPFREELEKVAGGAVERVRDAIIQAAALGRTPEQMLSGVRDVVAGHVGKFLTVARTAEMHAYTQSQMEFFQENNDVVKGWRWHSSLSFDTCLACLALHGREFDLREPMERHFNCRCMAIPVTKTWRELGFPNAKEHKRDWQTGEDWLRKQPEDIRLRALGKTRLDLLDSGEVSLEDFLGHADYPQWGGMYYERSTQGALDSVRKREIALDMAFIDRPQTAQEARDAIEVLQAKFDSAFLEFRSKIDDANLDLEDVIEEIKRARADKDAAREEALVFERSEIMAEINRLETDQIGLLDDHRDAILDRIVYVDNPSNVKVIPVTLLDKRRRAGLRQGMKAFNNMVGDHIQPGEELYAAETFEIRPSYDPTDLTIYCNQGLRVHDVVHEAGHRLECHNPDIQRKAFAYYDKRTAGFPEVSMRAVTGDMTYDPYEMTHLCGFLDPYMAKQYRDAWGNRTATEIVSMGMQLLFTRPEDLARYDPESFDFLFNLLRGL